VCSQEPAIGPHPEPDVSSQHPPTLFVYDSYKYKQAHLRLGLPSGSYFQAFG